MRSIDWFKLIYCNLFTPIQTDGQCSSMVDRQSQQKSESDSVCPTTTNPRPVCVLLLNKFEIKSVRKFNQKVFFQLLKGFGELKKLYQAGIMFFQLKHNNIQNQMSKLNQYLTNYVFITKF